MAIDKETQKALDRMNNRSIDFNPVIATSAPATDTDIAGVDNMQVYQSGGVTYLSLRVNGVPYQVALTAS